MAIYVCNECFECQEWLLCSCQYVAQIWHMVVWLCLSNCRNCIPHWLAFDNSYVLWCHTIHISCPPSTPMSNMSSCIRHTSNWMANCPRANDANEWLTSNSYLAYTWLFLNNHSRLSIDIRHEHNIHKLKYELRETCYEQCLSLLKFRKAHFHNEQTSYLQDVFGIYCKICAWNESALTNNAKQDSFIIIFFVENKIK